MPEPRLSMSPVAARELVNETLARLGIHDDAVAVAGNPAILILCDHDNTGLHPI